MSIGFKEWAIVCEALGRGDQHLILRKGGIAEGRDGFRFQHERFFLFPTLFHEQIARTTLPPETPLPASAEDGVRIEWMAEVAWTCLVYDLAAAKALAPFHILREEVVIERFHYDEPAGVNVALVRIFRLPEPWEFPIQRSYGGCRSWVELPDYEGAPPEPVESDAAFAEVDRRLRALVSELQPG